MWLIHPSIVTSALQLSIISISLVFVFVQSIIISDSTLRRLFDVLYVCVSIERKNVLQFVIRFIRVVIDCDLSLCFYSVGFFHSLYMFLLP